MVESVLVANRGEIAVRLIRGYRALGVRTVAIFSAADADAWPARLADAAEPVGAAAVQTSYLDATAVLSAAARAGVDAIDPGYGLLSENAGFARRVAEAGLTFIGPSPAAIEQMGSKIDARRIALEAGVAVVPGSDGAIESAAAAERLTDRLGFPLLVKASFGGGGRGMRLVRSADELQFSLRAAATEGEAAFGHAEVYLERAIERARHVEVQVLADAHGTVLHLGDRDCSTQRRHQKLVEEAPAPDLPDDVRAQMRESAVRLARRVGYTSTGTVEFLYDPVSTDVYFLEMNTRLQVEHPVTELVTGVDLVAERLRVARGEPLSITQAGVHIAGHAIEARIMAEDAGSGFRPRPGRATGLRTPGGPWIRSDFAVESGDAVPGDYDSLYGKVIAWGPTREMARIRLRNALREFRVSGVGSTAGYLFGVLGEPDFIAVRHHTNSVETDWVRPSSAEPADQGDALRECELPTTATAVATRTISVQTTSQVVVVRVPVGTRSATAIAPSLARRQRVKTTEASGRGSGDPIAPMGGVVVAVSVTVGQPVPADAVLFTLEAMKMQIPITAARAGRIVAIEVAVGQTVTAGQRLGVFESEPA